jgi:uncharacterized protein YggE
MRSNPKGGAVKPIRIAIAVLFGAAVVALAGVGRPESAAGGADKPSGGITVTGTGKLKAVPDQAEFSLGVQSEGRTAREALAANSERMKHVLAALRAAGVAKEDIQTQDVSVSPSYEDKGQISGYTTRNSVSVRIRILARAGAVLDAATNAGANDVYGPSLSRSDREALQAKALRSAVADARAKAEALADAAEVQLGSVTAIEEGSEGGYEPYFAATLQAQAADAPIEPGKQEIQARVTVTFAIG